MDKTNGFLCKLRAFGRATGANVAMMFGLSLLPLAVAATAGMDFANAMMVRNQMSDALDAAALALGARNNLSASDAQNLAQTVFNANYKGTGSPTVTPQISGQNVSVTAHDSVATTMLAYIGIPSVSVDVSTMVVWGQTKLWVTLVLDNTGSMSETDSTGTSKITALKSASHSLLTTLQNVSAHAGDVQVAIIPFAKDVKFPSSMYTSPNDTSWVDWTDWDSPPSSSFWTPVNTVGPGSNCPFTGVGCVTSAGGSSSTSKVPSSGLICPGTLTTSTPGGTGHHFQGCYDSVAQSTLTTVTTAVQPITDQFDCKTINGGTASCPESSGYPQNNGSGTNTVTTTTTSGYTGDSTSTTGPTTSNSNTTNGTQSCSTKKGTTTCTWTRTTTYTSTTVTTVNTGANFSHTWQIRDHANWTGCIMDRGPMTIPVGDVPANDYDTNASAPSSSIASSRFPAEINDSCPATTLLPLSYDWTALSNKVDAMSPNGGTNQGVGMAHGMQALTNVGPYNPGTLPSNTTRYIILLSDGLNTLDRWYGNGSAQSTSIDTREKAACDNAKAQGFIIYTVFVDLGGTQGSSSALQYCATDPSKYYDLTTSGAIVTAFSQIATQITNLRVAS